MSRIVQFKNGTSLTLEDRPFAKGGEGDLFKILNPISYQNFVAKIYKLEKRTKERQDKIAFLSSNSPKIPINDGHHSVIWIYEIIYDNDKFCGFVMPLAKGEKLELLCHSKIPNSLNKEWNKFDFQSPNAIELRLKLCFNIAVAVYHIHKLNNYVLIDMKPENIIVQSNGLISIIDIDSLAVINNNKLVYPAPVATPEYTPPEYYKGLKPDVDGINDTWDRFSMAVIFYRLLCGIHPFVGTCNSPYDNCHDLSDMVKNGLFANGLRQSFFKVIPLPHKNFEKLDFSVQELFKRCFDGGFNNPIIRPNPDEWCRCLSPQQVIQINRPLPSQTIFFPSYTFCKAISYNPSTAIEIPAIEFVNPPRSKGLKSLLRGIFGKSNQEKFFDIIVDKQKEIETKKQKFNDYSNELKNILREFSNRQLMILAQEKSLVENQKKRFDLILANLDISAKELHTKEADETKAISLVFANEINDIDRRTREAYSRILGKWVENYEAQKKEIQDKLRNLELLEQNEVKRISSDPKKLSKYRIATASIANFGTNIKSILASQGILTAADFIDISRDGYLKTPAGKWIKAAGVGWHRAYLLNAWREQLELRENQIISQTVKHKFFNEYISLANSLDLLNSNFEKEIRPFKTEYDIQVMVFNGLKSKANGKYKSDLANLKSKYDIKHNDFVFELNEYNKSDIIPKLKSISTDITKQIDDNFAIYISQFAAKMKNVNSYKEEFNSELQVLKTLHDQYHLEMLSTGKADPY